MYMYVHVHCVYAVCISAHAPGYPYMHVYMYVHAGSVDILVFVCCLLVLAIIHTAHEYAQSMSSLLQKGTTTVHYKHLTVCLAAIHGVCIRLYVHLYTVWVWACLQVRAQHVHVSLHLVWKDVRHAQVLWGRGGERLTAFLTCLLCFESSCVCKPCVLCLSYLFVHVHVSVCPLYLLAVPLVFSSCSTSPQSSLKSPHRDSRCLAKRSL